MGKDKGLGISQGRAYTGIPIICLCTYIGICVRICMHTGFCMCGYSCILTYTLVFDSVNFSPWCWDSPVVEHIWLAASHIYTGFIRMMAQPVMLLTGICFLNSIYLGPLPDLLADLCFLLLDLLTYSDRKVHILGCKASSQPFCRRPICT